MLFKYKALTKEGEQKNGTVDALNRDVAIGSLQQRGFTVVSIEESKKSSFLKTRIYQFQSVPIREIVVLSRQLSTLFSAQVSALRVFRLLASESENSLLREKLSEVADDIQGGASISSAMERHPIVFSNFYVTMVRIGEESGRLTDIFLKLADYLDRSYSLALKARNALIYPAFVIVIFIVVMALMLTLVFPRLADILLETNQSIPIYTKIVIATSNFFVNYGFLLLALLVAGGIVLWRLAQRPVGKKYFARLGIEMPFFGTLLKKFYLSRITDNLHIMLSSGIPATRAIEIASVSVNNFVYEEILRNAVEDIRGGSALSEALDGYSEIPGIIVQIIKVGEETGGLGEILETLSKFYQREVDNAVDVLVGLIEPALIVILALGVGLILSSVLIPIYNIAFGF